MPKRLYPVVIHKDPETEFGVSVIDFPATCGGAISGPIHRRGSR